MGSKWFLFGTLKDYLWKIILGLGSIVAALELFMNKVNEYFGIEMDGATYLFKLLYFVGPVLLFTLWWKFKLKRSLPKGFDTRILTKRNIINKYFSADPVYLILGLLLLLSCFTFPDFYGYNLFIPFFIIVGLITFFIGVCLFNLLDYIRQSTIGRKDEFKEWIKLGKLHYAILFGVVLLFTSIYYGHPLFETKNNRTEKIRDFKQQKVYDLYAIVDSWRGLSSKIKDRVQVYKIDQRNQKFQTGDLKSEGMSPEDYNQLLQQFNQIEAVNEAFTYFDILRSRIKRISEQDILVKDTFNQERILGYFDEIQSSLIQDTNLQAISADGFDQFSVMTNNTWVWLERALDEELKALQNSFQFKSLILFNLFLSFLLVLWLFIFTSNLKAYMDAVDKSKWKDFTALSFVNNYIIFVIILIIAAFTVSKGALSFEKPLWAGPWGAKKNLIVLDDPTGDKKDDLSLSGVISKLNKIKKDVDVINEKMDSLPEFFYQQEIFISEEVDDRYKKVDPNKIKYEEILKSIK